MKSVILRDHGILPGEDCTLKLLSLFEKHPVDTVFVFEKGDYYFTPAIRADYRLSNTDVLPERKLGLLLKDMHNILLDGNGATLYYAGQMQAVTMDHCSDVTMRGFTIDWKKPLVAEGTVKACCKDYVDLNVDPVLFPHRVRDHRLEFDIGNREWAPMNPWSHIQFDQNTHTVRRDSGDKFVPERMEELGDHTYRFFCKDIDTAIGNIFVLRHNERAHAGIFTEKCRNMTFEDITVYSCGGLGCLAQFCDTITYRRIYFLPNKAVGRQIASGRDDGMHITCCSGMITVTECSFLGLMDDPINVHSCCVTGVEWVNAQTLRCRYMHPQACGFHYWAEEGDHIQFVERTHMNPIGSAIAASYQLETPETFLLAFASPVSEELTSMDPASLSPDNLSHTASFTCTKNRFGSTRARGVLISTPKPVLIAENYFESSGSAILVAGDSNYWYESGACHDVEIRDNVFTSSCLSSMYQFCDGIISICPVVPEPSVDLPYHRNIRIHHNVFDSPDTPVLYAYSADSLSFTENRIFHSPSAEAWHPGKAAMKLSYCRNVHLARNLWVGPFSLGKLECDHSVEVISE